MERAFELGALDCWFTPIQMKKNRPATMLSVLCEPSKSDTLREMIYRETTTIGVRIRQIDRECLPREIVKVSTQFGDIEVKIARFNGEIVNATPEYNQVKRLAAKRNLAFQTVRDAAIKALDSPGKSSGAEV